MTGQGYSVAVVQTTARPSADQQGWTTLSLDLAVISPNGAAVGIETNGTSGCFGGSDCFQIDLPDGTQAEFTSASTSASSWPAGKVWPQTVSFDVPPGTSDAGFTFGGFTVPLNVTGDRVALPEIQVLAPVPMPGQVALNDGTDGYFMHADYGIALSRVTRQTSSGLPNWKVVQVNLSLLSRAGSRLGTIAWEQVDGQTCFIGETGNECLTVEWGGIERFEAAVRFQEGDSPLPLTNSLELPRGFGWAVAVSFLLPEDIGEATLVFGDNRIQLDVRGMTGDVPVWQYRGLYPELAAGTEVFKFGSKTVVLSAIEQETYHGDITLVFDATQGVGETTDFRPVVSVDASRITESGVLVDGLSVGTAVNSSFTPSVASVTALPIQPGGKQTFEITLPRVVGENFLLRAFSDDRPATVLASIIVSDAMSDAPTQATPAGLVDFARYPDEEGFWLPDLVVESITWDDKDWNLQERVNVEVVIRNISKIDAAKIRPNYFVGDTGVRRFRRDIILAAGETHTELLNFNIIFDKADIKVDIDAVTQLRERDHSNNSMTLPFDRILLPDLRINSMTWRTQRFNDGPAEGASVGDNIWVEFEVENVGVGIAPKSRVTLSAADGRNLFHSDGNANILNIARFPEWSVEFSGLHPGRKETRSILFPGSLEDVQLIATVGPGSSIIAELEPDLTNNTATMNLPALLKPDLVVQSITWEEHATTPGSFTYTVVVENVGAGRAIPLRERQLGIRVSVQGYVYSFDIIDTETGPTGFYWIAPGGTVTFTFDVDDSEPSFVKVVVDIVDVPSTTPFGIATYDNFIESDETNNEVTVSGPV